MQRSIAPPPKTRGQTHIFSKLVNKGESCIAISNNRELGNEIHGPDIKLSGWNRNNT